MWRAPCGQSGQKCQSILRSSKTVSRQPRENPLWLQGTAEDVIRRPRRMLARARDCTWLDYIAAPKTIHAWKFAHFCNRRCIRPFMHAQSSRKRCSWAIFVYYGVCNFLFHFALKRNFWYYHLTKRKPLDSYQNFDFLNSLFLSESEKIFLSKIT